MTTNKSTVQNPAKLAGTNVSGQLYKKATTPAAAKQQGANPTQAAQIGASAHKSAVVKEAAAPQTGLPKQASGAQQQAQQATVDKAKQFQQFTGFGDRVQKKIESRFNQDTAGQTANLQVHLDAVQEIIPKNNQEAVDALEAFRTNPNEASLQALSAFIPEGTATQATMDGLYNSIGESLGQESADLIRDESLLQDFQDTDWQELGFMNGAGEVANLLGIDEAQLSTMTLADLENTVAELQQNEFNEVEQLKMQLAQQPDPNSAVSQQIRNQLEQMGAVGLVTSEQRINEVIESINEADEIQVGEDNFTVDELLSDEGISSQVEQWLAADPETRKEIFGPEFSQFTEWLTSQEANLQTLQEEMKATTGTYEAAQVDLEAFSSQVDSEMWEAVGLNPPPQGATSEQIRQFKEDAKKNPVVSLLLNEDVAGDLKSKLTPQNMEMLEGKSAAEITDMFNTAEMLRVNPELAAALQMDEVPDFVQSNSIPNLERLSAQVELINNAGQSMSDLMANETFATMFNNGVMTDNMLKYAGTLAPNGQSVLTDPNILKELQSGKLKSYQLPEAAKALESQAEYNNTVSRLGAARTADDILDVILGDNDLSFSQLRDNWSSAQRDAKKGSRQAQAYLDQMSNLDFNQDGILTEEDMLRFKSKTKDAGAPSIYDMMNNSFKPAKYMDATATNVKDGIYDRSEFAMDQQSKQHAKEIRDQERRHEFSELERQREKRRKDRWVADAPKRRQDRITRLNEVSRRIWGNKITVKEGRRLMDEIRNDPKYKEPKWQL